MILEVLETPGKALAGAIALRSSCSAVVMRSPIANDSGVLL